MVSVSDKKATKSIHTDGTLSSTEFCSAAFAFADKWKIFDSSLPHWSWVPSTKKSLISAHQVEGYLLLQNVVLPTFSEEDHNEGRFTGQTELSCSDSDEPIDDAILVQSCSDDVHHYDFHVVYSGSYRVPVLYFRAYCSDGQPLTLDDIEKDLPANSAKVLSESKWTFVTQEEHPYLNRPWYTLHPCGTSEWMKLLLNTTKKRDDDDSSTLVAEGGVVIEKYLAAWLSVVGQVFGLKIPFEMVRTCN
ncbi:hypothetical protein LguiB_030927 [Lonicera macranthoides]